MNAIKSTAFGLMLGLLIFAVGCATEPGGNSNSNAAGSPSPSASPSLAGSVSKATAVTLPVLDALFSNEAFKSSLKSKVELTDDQLAQLQKIASEEVARLRESNIEGKSAEEGYSPAGSQCYP